MAYHDHENAEPTIKIDWQSLRTLNNPVGSVTTLQWDHDNNSPFYSSSRRTSRDPQTSLITSNNPPNDWMHSIYNQISCLTLKEIVVPGSHDAGMFEFNEGAGLASPVNTVTQKIDIGSQLKYGSRYFDIRPVISGGGWKTGHYGWICILGVCEWRGGNGQDLPSIINQVNSFTANNNELVILDLTHGLYTDDFHGEHNSGLTQAQWDDLMTRLLRVNHRAIGFGRNSDITNLKLFQLIQNTARVLIIVDDTTRLGKTVDTSRFADHGIFNRAQFKIINDYADTNNQEKMVQDQLSLLKAQRTSPTSTMLVLSWTLTQSNPTESIVDNGDAANKALPELLWPALSPRTYPNVLMVDAYPKNSDIAALAMAINLWHTKIC